MTRSMLAPVLGAVRRRGVEARTVWIMGSPRSGSTWLLNLLHLLTGAVKLDEPLIGAHLGVPVDVVTGVPDPRQQSLFDAGSGRPDYVFSDEAAAVWRPALRRLILDRCAHAAARGGGRGKPLIAVKEPNGSLGAPIIMSLLPKTRLLFLTRDGRDVVDSVLDGASGGWMTEVHGVRVEGDAARADVLRTRAHHWVASTRAVNAAYDAHDAQRRLRTSYELLRRDPVAELERIARWVGRADAVPKVPEVVERLDVDAIPAERRGAGRFVRAATPGLWQDRFSDDEKATLEAVMGSTLRQLGYPVTGAGAPEQIDGRPASPDASPR